MSRYRRTVDGKTGERYLKAGGAKWECGSTVMLCLQLQIKAKGMIYSRPASQHLIYNLSSIGFMKKPKTTASSQLHDSATKRLDGVHRSGLPKREMLSAAGN